MAIAQAEFQILHVSAPVTEQALSGLTGVVYVETEEHNGLVYTDPRSVYLASSQLEYFGARVLVLPDYALATVAANSRRCGFAVTGIDLPNDRVLEGLSKELVASGRTDELRELLEETQGPVTAVHLNYEGFEAKLQGAGVVTITGPSEEFPYRFAEILQRLTLCLLDVLKDSYLNKRSSGRLNSKSFAKTNVVMV